MKPGERQRKDRKCEGYSNLQKRGETRLGKENAGRICCDLRASLVWWRFDIMLTEEEKRQLREEMKEAARKMDELFDKAKSKETDDETFHDDDDDSSARGDSV